MSWETISPRQELENEIKNQGGWVNSHAHIDRSHIINQDNWALTNDTLEKKWDYTDEFKQSSTPDQIAGHMSRTIEQQLEQGVRALGSFIDCDSVVKDKSLLAAQMVRDKYRDDIDLVFMNQPIKGLRVAPEREWFEYAADFVDIIGGLPERDAHMDPLKDRSEEHFDTIFKIAAERGKPLHIHIDQLNSPDQIDTERAVEKTRQYQYKGKVALVHCISLAAHAKDYRERIYKELNEQDISVITCPSAWIDHKRSETLVPSHNAITPVDEMLAHDVRVAIGTDNIADIYKPFSDGNMWTELRFLLESCRIYDIKRLAQIATSNGLRTLHLSQPANTPNSSSHSSMNPPDWCAQSSA